MPKSDSEPVPTDDLTVPTDFDPLSSFHQFFDSVPEAVIEVDASGKIVFANSKVEEVFGYRPVELLNQGVEILLPKDLRTSHAAMRANYAEKPKDREMGSGVEFAGLRKDGTQFSADVALNPIRLKNYPAFHTLAFIRDVTHLRRMEITERELLDKTLLGLVMTLNSLMSMTSPWIFDRTQSIRALVSHMARGFSPSEIWQYQLAAELCLIGCIAVPPTVCESVWTGAILSEEEAQVFRSHPEIGQKLLSSIPRLEEVAEIIGKQQSAIPPGTGRIETGVWLLRLAQQADQLLYQGKELASILQQLRRMYPQARADLLIALASYTSPRTVYEAKSLFVSELTPGMILGEDLTTDGGLLIALGGTKISMVLLERIRNFARMAGAQKRIQVRWNKTAMGA